ncbi:MAG: hypothetical protein RRY97_08555 [Oscillibacter sp.]
MANQSRCRMTQKPPSAAPRSGVSEPCVRRWPHPIEGAISNQQIDPSLYYIRCALSYQNQMLGDIKALLQQLVMEKMDNQKP